MRHPTPALYASAEHIAEFSATLSYSRYYEIHLKEWITTALLGAGFPREGLVRVLDLGSGSGMMGLALARSLMEIFRIEITAIDPSAALINKLIDNYSLAVPVVNLTTALPMGFQQMVQTECQFDCVLCSHSLYQPLEAGDDCTGSADVVLKGLMKLLGPRGIFCVILASPNSWAYISKSESYRLLGMRESGFSHSETFRAALERRGAPFTTRTVDTYADTSSFEFNDEDRRRRSLRWLSFFLRIDCEQLTVTIQDRLLAIYRHASIPFRCLPEAEQAWCTMYPAESIALRDDSLILFHKENVFIGCESEGEAQSPAL